MIDLADKTAFITGGASGIGLGMATAFAQSDMNVVIADISAERLSHAEQQLRKITDHVLALEVDATDRASLETAAARTEATFGALHVLCNNAGIGGGGLVLETSEERWRHTHEVNFWGPLNGIQTFLPSMLDHGEEGHVVNTSSFSGIQGHHHQSGYGTSKFALVGLSEFLRNDLAETNISVSVLCPHVVDTPIFYPDLAPDDTEAIRAKKESLPFLATMAVSPETVGQQVLQGIQNDELYIFCDGVQSRAMLETRCENMLAAMDRQFPNREAQ
ncbi:MAG: SDR family NAD(P)-dependent oxidoreductase [Pseudomonadales bacterium]|nr:SDR family NAD(P)-dependent oxidoreductase [Pseudomonadales bacterium]